MIDEQFVSDFVAVFLEELALIEEWLEDEETRLEWEEACWD